jgi:hypothetical protein
MSDADAIDDAYKRGDLAALKAALGDPPDFPNCRGPRGGGEIVLEYAIYHSPLAFIRRLLELGAEANYRDHAGFPSLIAALSSGRPERYEIEGVTKVGEDQWRFTARIQYGDTNVTLPVVVTMLWAGDTPMVSLTDLTIPLLGTFTARVIFYRDRYAGTWQHDEVGGHLFGVIEKAQ